MSKKIRILALMAIAVITLGGIGRGLSQFNFMVYLPIIIVTPSPTPTITPTPTQTLPPQQTPTKTSTPTATQPVPPTPIPASVFVVPESTFSYASGYGSFYVLGDVTNNTALNVEYVFVTADFFNSQGMLVDAETGIVYLDILESGETSCFDIIFSAAPVGWSYYTFEISYSETSENLQNLTILSSNPSNPYGTYKVVGMARNDDTQVIDYPFVVGTFYNASSKVVGCDTGITATYPLNPGVSSSFTIYGPNTNVVGAITRYRVQGDASN